jgi:hypothetical protein
MDAGTAVHFADKAAGAVFDMAVNYVDHMDLLRRGFPHAFQKSPGDVHGVALFPLGAAVQYENLHGLYLL